MAYLPQALAHARSRLMPTMLTALVSGLVAALVAALLVVPLAGSAEATRAHPHKTVKAQKQAQKKQAQKQAHKRAHKKAQKKAAQRAEHARKAKHAKKSRKHRKPKKPVVIGQPRSNYVMPVASYFSYPNRSKAERMVIRNRVLETIRSTWGGKRTSLGTPRPGNGTIRIATWSFDDWSVAKALVAAKKRGVSVQVIGAKAANKGHASWSWLRDKLGQKLYRPGHPETAELVSFARQCRGACRGPGGTAHAKYFLFDNVGADHQRHVVVQTSMNLTTMAFSGQWNEAQVLHSSAVHADFLSVFKQARQARPVLRAYHVRNLGLVVNYFFPRPRAKPSQDPVMQNLNEIHCQFTVGGALRRSKVRIIQYAIYGDRGVWIAKKLRYLWNAGCDVAFIYSLASRPVLKIMRSHTRRGPIPMKQSVIKDSWGNIIKYNHSKWMAITGRFGDWYSAAVVLDGSANWADLAFGDDEQMQRMASQIETRRHLAAFAKTWRQKSSTPPSSARVVSFGRGVPIEVHEKAKLGKGIYRYLPLD